MPPFLSTSNQRTSLSSQWIPTINGHRITAKSPQALRECLDIIISKAPHLASRNLKDDPRIDAMPRQQLKFQDNGDGTCLLSKHNWLLGASLNKIGFMKNESGEYALVYDDAEQTPEKVWANLEALTAFRGWDLITD